MCNILIINGFQCKLFLYFAGNLFIHFALMHFYRLKILASNTLYNYQNVLLNFFSYFHTPLSREGGNSRHSNKEF